MNTPRHFSLVAVGLAAAVLVAAPIACAQPQAVERLNRDVLVEKLRDLGMNELLLHMSQTEHFGDPVDAQALTIDVLIVTAKDEKIEQAQRIRAAEEAIKQLDALATAHRDHLKRPLWQTQMGELQLFLYLTSLQQLGMEFYCYGVANKEQRAAVEANASMAYVALKDAQATLSKMDSDFPRKPEIMAVIGPNGQWDRMRNDYMNLRTPFLCAWAAHLVAFLPDSAPYYQNLRQNRLIPDQRATPAAERERLFAEAIDNLGRIEEKQLPKLGDAVKLVSGLCQVGQAKYDLGLRDLREVKTAGQPLILAQIGMAVAMEGKGDRAGAQEFLKTLAQSPTVKSNLLFQLLIVDARHRLLRKRAVQPEEIEAAYGPYTELFEDSELGDKVDAVRNFIYRRWADSTSREQRATEPTMVQMAIGEILRTDGQNLVAQHMQLKEEGKQAAAQEKLDEASKSLKECVEVLEALLARENPKPPPAVGARAMYNRAFATYLQNPNALGGVLRAAELFAEVAEKYPEEPMAEPSIKIALDLVRPLADPNQQHEAAVKVPATKAYIKAAHTLLDKFPNSAAAAGERLFFAFHILQSSRRFAEAVDVYARVPNGHPDFVGARSEMMYCLQELYKSTTDPKLLDQYRKDLDAASIELNAIITQEMQNRDNLPPKRLLDLRKAQATMLLAQAETAIGSGQAGRASVLLDDFEKQFPEKDFEGMLREAMEKKVKAQIASERYDDAVATAQKMMDRFPDDAAGVVDGVLRYLDTRLRDQQERIRSLLGERAKAEATAVATRIASTADKMADLLLEWAKPRKDIDELQMVGFVRIKAKALGMSGRAKEAVELLEPYATKFPNDAGLRYSVGEAYYLQGVAGGEGAEAALKTAMSKFNQLISVMNNMLPEVQSDPGLTRVWWATWTRDLQAIDALFELNDKKPGVQKNPYEPLVKEIPLRVRQLLLDDPNLGGDPWKTDLTNLSEKHMQRLRK